MCLYLSVLPCVCLLCKDRGCLDNLHISVYLPVDLWLTCIFCIWRRCTLRMGLHSSAFFIDIENMILPPSSSLWALIPCRHTQINTHAYTNGWRKVWWKKHNIFLSLPGSWVIFILNARKLLSLSFYTPLSGFYLPFTSRALFLPLLLCSFSPSIH